MLAYTIRKLLLMIPTILGIVLLTFVLFNVVASDPAIAYGGKNKTPEQLAGIRHRLGLDKPRWLNFRAVHSAGQILHVFDSQFFNTVAFHFPLSLRYEESVWTLMARKAPVS